MTGPLRVQSYSPLTLPRRTSLQTTAPERTPCRTEHGNGRAVNPSTGPWLRRPWPVKPSRRRRCSSQA